MMGIKEIKENKLKTILRFSIPSIIAMLLETIITITDGFTTVLGTRYNDRSGSSCTKICI